MSVRLGGAKLRFAPTCTAPLAVTKPNADALIVAAPKLMPYTFGTMLGTVAPAGTNTLNVSPPAGVIATFELSLLVSVTVTPFGPAGTARLTGNGTVTPGAIVRALGM